MVGLWGMMLFGIITNRAIIIDDPTFVENAIDWPFKKWTYAAANGILSQYPSKHYTLQNDDCFMETSELAVPLSTEDLEVRYPEPVQYWATNCPSFHFIARNPRCI